MFFFIVIVCKLILIITNAVSYNQYSFTYDHDKKNIIIMAALTIMMSYILRMVAHPSGVDTLYVNKLLATQDKPSIID